MRRPVKPFVTEYKGPSRRPAFQTTSPARRSFEDPGLAAQAGETMSRGDPMQANEDSYEAAMRAADALFSPPLTRPQVQDAAIQAPPSVPNPELASPALESPKTELPPRGGRILRVIDEPEVLLPAGLEEEHMPKRRGRKPGSKNKPKAAIAPESHGPLEWTPAFPGDIDAGGLLPSGIFANGAATPRKSAPVPPARTPASPLVRQPAPAEPRKPPASREPGEGAVSDYAARNNMRFPWVRTKLAPGEQWKRRLPKVCW